MMQDRPEWGGGGICPGPQTYGPPKSTIEAKDNIHVIDAVHCGGGVGSRLKILRRAAKIIWAAVHTCGSNSYSVSMSSEMKTNPDSEILTTSGKYPFVASFLA